MFQGYSNETFEFFMAIRFNNNRTFFHENHDWYLRDVRQPCLELAAALSDTVYAIDPLLETRPEKVVARINRDIRFSNDKSPYRDYIWLAFRQPGENRKETIGMFFDMSAEGGSYGMGIYNENKPLMRGLRHALETDTDAFCEAAQQAMPEFSLYGNAYKRIAIPENLPDMAKAWYPMRGFYIEKDIPDFSLLKSPDLAEEIKGGMERFAPLYQYIKQIEPIE